jgi:hypothetical protein
VKFILKICLSLYFTSTAYAFAGTTMNYEGSCQGILEDGTEIHFTYYSNFDGCKENSRSALTFSEGMDGLYMGNRTFTDKSDNYSFTVKESGKKKEILKLALANSTGNTSANFTYIDEFAEEAGRKTVQLQCEVRDYEYSDC